MQGQRIRSKILHALIVHVCLKVCAIPASHNEKCQLLTAPGNSALKFGISYNHTYADHCGLIICSLESIPYEIIAWDAGSLEVSGAHCPTWILPCLMAEKTGEVYEVLFLYIWLTSRLKSIRKAVSQPNVISDSLFQNQNDQQKSKVKQSPNIRIPSQCLLPLLPIIIPQ